MIIPGYLMSITKMRPKKFFTAGRRKFLGFMKVVAGRMKGAKCKLIPDEKTQSSLKRSASFKKGSAVLALTRSSLLMLKVYRSSSFGL
jgi:hypothetical protein